jgi:CRP-like cAMP-binding protein
MEPQEDCRPSNVRALLKTTGTPFTLASFEHGAAIFRQGDPADSVMHVETGRVWLAVTTRSGNEAICGLFERGAFLGNEVLCGRTARRQTAIAMTATDVLVIPKAQMIRLLHTQPAIADRFIAHIITRQARLEADLTAQLLSSTEQRLARALLALGGCAERRPCRCVLPRVSQEVIAEIVGTTRSRVNVFLGKFKELGLIEAGGGALKVTPTLLHVVDDGHRGISKADVSVCRPDGLTHRINRRRHDSADGRGT